MTKVLMLLITVCALTLAACGRDANSPYSDPNLPERPNPHSGLGLYLPDNPGVQGPRFSGVPGQEGTVKEFTTGDESAIVSAMPKRAPEHFIYAPGRIIEGRTILI